jgi:hypothetical protein
MSASPVRNRPREETRDREGWWRHMLDKCKADRGSRDFATYRIIVCGELAAGKRTLTTTLRESLTFGDRFRAQVKKHYGVDYSYVDVRRQDGTMRHCVEFLVLDTPALVDAVLDADHIGRCAVILSCDVSEPRKSVPALSQWVTRINARVAALIGTEKAHALAKQRLDACTRGVEAYRGQMTAAPSMDPSDETKFELRTVETVCLLPCVVAGTKLDLVDTLPAAKVNMPPKGYAVGADRFLRDAIRAFAARSGAAIAMFQDARGSSGADDFNLAVAEFAVALAADPTDVPSVAALSGALGVDLSAGQFAPPGADDFHSIPQAISAQAISVEEVFPATVSADAGTPAAQYDTHQDQLRVLATTITPIAASHKPAPAPRTDKSGDVAASSGSPHAGGADDDVDFDFD